MRQRVACVCGRRGSAGQLWRATSGQSTARNGDKNIWRQREAQQRAARQVSGESGRCGSAQVQRHSRARGTETVTGTEEVGLLAWLPPFLLPGCVEAARVAPDAWKVGARVGGTRAGGVQCMAPRYDKPAHNPCASLHP